MYKLSNKQDHLLNKISLLEKLLFIIIKESKKITQAKSIIFIVNIPLWFDLASEKK